MEIEVIAERARPDMRQTLGRGENGGRVILYHRTTKDAAHSIRENGFRDATGAYLTKHTYTGVWFADVPLDENEGADGSVLLEVDLNVTDKEVSEYEWVEQGKPYREWLIPAEFVNARGQVRVVDVEPE